MIVRNPKIRFGAPTIKGTRIIASTIYYMNKNGDSVKFLAHVYDLKEYQVREAINFCKKYIPKKYRK